MIITRRAALVLLNGTVAACAHPGRILPGDALAALEAQAGGRLGVHAFEAETGRSLGHRADERFGMCSTFKLLLAAAALRECDAGRLSLDERIAYSQADMVFHAPVTQTHLAEGAMTVRALAEAAQTTSDNVAANLLLRRLGGPAAFTEKVRALGDAVTRLDRYEPEMNLVPPGEVRDTTTPRAMSETLGRILTGDLLSVGSRQTLIDWMIATRTGLARLRAGLPADWRVGDKTGTGIAAAMPNKHNDVAAMWPPGRGLIVAAVYYEAPAHFESMRPEDDATVAAVGRIIGAAFSA